MSCREQRRVIPAHAQVRKREATVTPTRKGVALTGDDLFQRPRAALVIAPGQLQLRDVRPQRVLDARCTGLLRKREGTLVVPLRVRRIAHGGVHGGDGVEALHQHKRIVRPLVQIERLQLICERLVQAAVAAIHPADAVEHGSEVGDFVEGLVLLRHFREFDEGLAVPAGAEQSVAPHMERLGRMNAIADAEEIVPRLLEKAKPLVFSVGIRQAHKSQSRDRAAAAITFGVVCGGRPLAPLARFGIVAG